MLTLSNGILKAENPFILHDLVAVINFEDLVFKLDNFYSPVASISCDTSIEYQNPFLNRLFLIQKDLICQYEGIHDQ